MQICSESCSGHDFFQCTDWDCRQNQYWEVEDMNVQNLTITLLATAIILILVVESEARHKCPKVPSPPGLLGITTMPTLLPSGTFMAAARSSNTSGCGKAHPSEGFYRPSRLEMEHFIEENKEIVSEETARGRGSHLKVLARLTGCEKVMSRFARILKNHHWFLFPQPNDMKPSLSNPSSAEFITDRIFKLSTESPMLSSSCRSS